MGFMSYYKCIACIKDWVNDSTAKYRVEWAEIMLSRYLNLADWEVVRFSDEVYFGYRP